jgi:hypothetical protein
LRAGQGERKWRGGLFGVVDESTLPPAPPSGEARAHAPLPRARARSALALLRQNARCLLEGKAERFVVRGGPPHETSRSRRNEWEPPPPKKQAGKNRAWCRFVIYKRTKVVRWQHAGREREREREGGALETKGP